MAGFYHVYLRPKFGIVTTARRQAIELALGAALSWYRYGSNTWVVFTVKDAKHWYGRLRQYVQPGGHVFVARLDITDRCGWMSRAFWDWVKRMSDKYPHVGRSP